MKRRYLLSLVIVVIILPLLAGGRFDKRYVKKFKWGSVVTSDKGYPPYTQYKKEMFDYRKGVFYIKAGPDAKFDMRALVRGGKPHKYYLNQAKKRTKRLKKHFIRDIILVNIWVSHDDEGKKIAKKWPKKFNELPKWFAYDEVRTNCVENCPNSPTGGWVWRSNDIMASFKRWVRNAKPGYKMYVVFRAGYTRHYPEGKYYDKLHNVWKIPTKDELSDVFARGTIIFK